MAEAMPYIRVASTAELDTETLASIRALLEEVFPGDFSDDDWEHALGGVHALAYDGDELVGHGSVVERRLVHDGRAVATGYIEGMGVRRAARGRGYGAAVMRVLEQQIDAGCELGALAATDEAAPFYARRGWVQWTGTTDPDGEGAVYVRPGSAPVDTAGTLSADARSGDAW
jgi:aminoglycoside 2'-N-acetyltransferase I